MPKNCICDDDDDEITCPKGFKICCQFCDVKKQCESELGYKPCLLTYKECKDFYKEHKK